MTSEHPPARGRPARVALAAAPPLLLDSLRELLSSDGNEVTVVLDGTKEPFDVAVVTSGPPPVDAPLIIELADGPAGHGTGTVRGRGGDPIVVLEGLPAIIDFVTAWSRHHRHRVH